MSAPEVYFGELRVAVMPFVGGPHDGQRIGVLIAPLPRELKFSVAGGRFAYYRLMPPDDGAGRPLGYYEFTEEAQ